MAKMKAIRINQKCEPEELVPSLVDRPQLKAGYVLIEVKAFGVNESEVLSRKGESSADFSFPRILGIEGVGIVAETNADSAFEVGQKVATMMGGLGRAIDGSYAAYTLAKEENVIPLETQLNWETIGALPEMLQTAYGSLVKGLQLAKKDVLLIRGGTSTVGLMAAVLAKDMGATVISTSRNPKKLAVLEEYGVDYPVLDDQEIDKNIKKIAPNGVDKVLELVGFTALFQDMSFLRLGGYICVTGALDGQWTLDNFYPFMIPSGVFMTSYAGEATDLPASVFNNILNKIEHHEISVPIAKVYNGLENVGAAQRSLESGRYSGKIVVAL